MRYLTLSCLMFLLSILYFFLLFCTFLFIFFFFFQAEDGIRDDLVTGVQTCALPIFFVAFIVTGSIAGLFTFGLGFPRFSLFFGILGAFWVFTVISAIFLKRSYEKISQRLNVSAFATTGLLYLIGAALTIVFVGFLILLVALIFQVVAYFSIQDRPPSPGWGQPAPQTFSSVPVPQQPAMSQQKTQVESKFCFKCGAKLPSVAVFCTGCGAKQA